MSWFDSSFSLARTALSQAQKSIDKVLDIKEENRAGQRLQEPDPSTSSSAQSDSLNEEPETSPKFSTSTPKPNSSSRSTTSPTQSSSPPPLLKKKTDPPQTAPSPSQDSFTSTWGGSRTWGGGNSLWNSSGTPQPRNDLRDKPPSSVSPSSSSSSSSSSVRRNRASRNRQREGSATGKDSGPLSLPSSIEKRKTSKEEGKVVEEPQLTSSPAKQTVENSKSTDSLQAKHYPGAADGAENAICENSKVLEKPNGPVQDGTQSGLSTKPLADSIEPGVNDLTITHEHFSSTSNSSSASSRRSKEEMGTQIVRSDGEGRGGEVDVALLVPPTDTTDAAEHEIDTVDTASSNMPPTGSSESISRSESISEQVSQAMEDTTITLHRTKGSPTANTPVETSYSPRTVSPSTSSSSQSQPLQPSLISPPLPSSSTAHSSTVVSNSSTQHDIIIVEQSEDLEPVLEPTKQVSPSLAAGQVKYLETVELGRQKEEEEEGAEERNDLVLTREEDLDTSVRESKSEPVAVDNTVEERWKEEKEKESNKEKEEEEEEEEKEAAGGDTEFGEAQQEELRKLKKLLEARETKMVEMSREMIQLSETNQDLQSKLSAAEHDLHTSRGGVEDLRSEFAKRIASTEKKLQTIIKERDSLKKQLQVITTEQSHQRKTASQELSVLLKEKEEQIAGLMEEGEKLSKKELQNSNIIKRLKEKNKQNDQLLTAQRQQIEDFEREVGRLKDLVKKREENEKKYQDSLSQLNDIAEQQEKELTAIKGEKDELTDKARSLQTNLDNAYKELSELHKATAVNKTAAHEAVLSVEQTARQELTEAMEKQRVEHHREKEKLLLEINELRSSVSRCEQQAAWREERMKQEVSDVQQRLQEAEMRNQELTTTISQTTKPFLRQIETLRNAHSTQTANWEKVEADLTHRLVEAQTQLNGAVEKERSATEKALTLQSRITQLEKQMATLRQEKSRLAASLELEKAKAETLEEGQLRETTKMEAMRCSMQQSLEELRKEKEMLERQLEYERVRLEAESRKATLESQEKERLRSQLASSLSRALSRQSSTASTTHTQSEILEKSLVHQIGEDVRGGSVCDSGTSLYQGRTPTTTASAIEQLQSLLKQKEGELANSQTLVNSLERSRAAMASDLAVVTSQNSDLNQQVETIPQLQTRLVELQKRNEALLQMYGEKAEETEELKLDIQDLKEMYRQQIDTLTTR